MIVYKLYFLGLNIKLVYSLYFTMSNMKTIIPVLNGRLETGLFLPLHTTGSKHITYGIRNIQAIPNGSLNIDSRTGVINISSSDWSNITAEVIAQDYSKATTNTFLEMNFIPVEECSQEILENLCFWSKVTYQVKRTDRGILLGIMTPKTELGGCHYKHISYDFLSGTDVLKLYPPDKTNKLWMLGISGDFDKIVDNANISKLCSNISCTIETSKAVLSYTKQIEIKVLNSGFGSLNPQEQIITILLDGTKLKKGHTIDKNIMFLDGNPLNGNNYYAFVDDEAVSDFLIPQCSYLPDSREGNNGTAIHCKLLVKKSRILRKNVSFLLGLRHTNLEDKETNTAFINITLILENSYSKRYTNYFKNESKIFRTAGPFARVIQPFSYMRNMMNFQIEELNFNRSPFRITEEGIVYVYDFIALRDSPEHLRLNITWTQNNIVHSEEIFIRIIDEPNKTCVSLSTFEDWTFCSQFKNQRSCVRRDVCALGTGGATSVETRSRPQRCMWRGDKSPENHETHMYSTCTADTKYCPDGICDSLEILKENETCPQDCSKQSTFPTRINSKTGRGVDKCNGVLVCESLGCFCNVKIISEPSVAKSRENKLVAKNHDKKTCGLTCITSISGGIVVFVGAVFIILIFWRIKHVKNLTKEKYINNIQEGETPFSDYIDRNVINEPLVLNFNMTSTLDNRNFNTDILKSHSVDSKWEFPRNQIFIEQILGEGEFGKVLKAKAFNIAGKPGYSLVAVKTLKDDARKQDFNDLYSEYELLKEVSHPHVIQLLGVCSSDDGPLYVIIEYARYGSLRNYLRRSRHILTNTELANTEENLIHKVTPRDILSFARQISSGMSYLSDIKLVHRDLAARNILLAENKVCKVSDFGLTRDIYEDNAYFKKSKGRVPVKWMAPESLADHVYTTKSDVWSFGILIWELITLGASPYPGIPAHNLYNLLKEGYRMEKPPNCSAVLYSLMKRCWSINPDERPSFLELYHCFDGLLTDNVNYLELSDNAIINKSYFSMDTETELSSSPSTNLNLLENYPLHKDIPNSTNRTPISQESQKERNSCLGYETPTNNPRKVMKIITPTNEMPEEYTDMNFKEM